MAANFEYRRRLVNLIIPTIVLVVAISNSIFSPESTALLLMAGAIFGGRSGYQDWEQIRKQITNRNTIIVFATDSVWYGLVLFLGIMSLYPNIVSPTVKFLARAPELLFGTLLFCLIAGIARNAGMSQSN